jgi:putative glutamine amidotransferase
VTDRTVEHRQTDPGWITTHDVRVDGGSRLATVLGASALAVNSFHHQAIERLGDGLRAVAWSADGVIEGVEGDGERLILGVQWHAETLEQDGGPHARLFRALVDAGRGSLAMAA